MNKGFVLIEALIAMIAYSFILITMSSITLALKSIPEITFISQLDVFKLQLDQMFSRSKNFELVENQLCFNLDLRHFCLVNENSRLVKKPGYEILIDSVIEIQWELNENEIKIHGVWYENPFTFVFEFE
ncbi:MAG: hypothetical protein CVU85_04985 [Firmicutes bacterium HGW-Firmicutes-10]|jgi:competence protein ComGF|nr:MAG: hypothetical protein CVU85_04985 [Firmicutes bacterium HGW-Firmicutes-10]